MYTTATYNCGYNCNRVSMGTTDSDGNPRTADTCKAFCEAAKYVSASSAPDRDGQRQAQRDLI